MIPRSYCKEIQLSSYGQRPPAMDPDIRDQLARFELFLMSCKRSASTRRSYVAAVRRWLEAGGTALHIDHGRLIAWLRTRRKTVAQATINIELRALRAWLKWLHILGTIDAGPEIAKLPRQRRQPARLPRFLTDDQVGRALAMPDPATMHGLRDLLILRLLYECGLRSGELAAITLDDLQRECWLFVGHVQFGRCRYLPITPDTSRLIDRYIQWRRENGFARSAHLLLSRSGRRLRATTIAEIVARHLYAAIGIGAGYGALRLTGRRRPWSGLYPHLLRASFATALLDRGCPITAVAQMLGHESVASTACFVGTVIAPLRAAIECHPRGRRHAQASTTETDDSNG